MSLLNKTKIQGTLQGYTILKCLDQGSQGQVYQVLGDDQKIYALKISNYMKEGEIKFLNIYFEKLQSNKELLKQYEYFQYQNRNVIIQEFCSGGNLYNYIQSHPLTNIEVKKILLEITRQLEVLHQLNLAHRDIKPENILIQIDEMNETQKYKICDFGEIREIKDISNRFFQTIGVGTPYYQSPEVLETNNYDLSIDIWSLGAMIYELYTNTPLFNGLTLNEISSQIKNYILDQSHIHGLIDELKIDEHLKTSIKNMLNVNPIDRPSLSDVQGIWNLRKSVDFEEQIEKKKEQNQLQQINFQFTFQAQNKQPQSFIPQFNMNQQQMPNNQVPQTLNNQLPQFGQGFQNQNFNNNINKFQMPQNNFGMLHPAQQNFPVFQQNFPISQQTYPISLQTQPASQQSQPVSQQAQPSQQQNFPVLQQIPPASQQNAPVQQYNVPASPQTNLIQQQNFTFFHQIEPATQQNMAVKPTQQQIFPAAQQNFSILQQNIPVSQQPQPTPYQNIPASQQAQPVSQQAQPVSQQTQPVSQQASPQLTFLIPQSKQNFPLPQFIQQENNKQLDGQNNKQQITNTFNLQNNQFQFNNQFNQHQNQPQNQFTFKMPQFLIQQNQQDSQSFTVLQKEEKSKLLISQMIHKEILIQQKQSQLHVLPKEEKIVNKEVKKNDKIKIISKVTNAETQVDEEELIALSGQVTQKKVSFTDQQSEQLTSTKETATQAEEISLTEQTIKIESEFKEYREANSVQESQKIDQYEVELTRQANEDNQLRQINEPKSLQDLLQSVFNFPLKPMKLVDCKEKILDHNPSLIQDLTNQLCEQFQIFQNKK